MADDASPANPQHRNAAVLGVVEAFLEQFQGPPNQDRADDRGQVARQGFFQQSAESFHQPFADLQGHITDEPVADDDIHAAVIEITALDVSDKVDVERLKQLVSLAGELVSLDILCPVREQPDARPFASQDDAVKNLAHDGELFQVLGLRVHAGADIQHDRGPPVRGGEDSRQRGPVHTFQPSPQELYGNTHRTGVSGADQPVGLSIPHQLGPDSNGGVPFASKSARAGVLHGDDLARVDDPYRKA